MKTIDSVELDPQFKHDVADHPGGENIRLCFACGTCTAGCPVSEIDDSFNPRKIIRQILLGLRKDVLAGPEIWRCVQCYSCTSKCPQNVRFREIVRALREMAVAENFADEILLEKIDEVGRLAQQLRRKLSDTLTTNPDALDELKQSIENLVNTEQ